MNLPNTSASQARKPGIDPIKLRLAVLGLLIVTAFVGLFSRLWFLQVLASPQFRELAKENRVRDDHREPPRGRILDRNGVVLVDNRGSLSFTIDRQVLKDSGRQRAVIRRLAKLAGVKPRSIERRLRETTISPYSSVPVVNDISEDQVGAFRANKEDFPGVGVEIIPVRVYPRGELAPHLLGWVNEITPQQLKQRRFKGYDPGDIVGRGGVEYTYDRWLRGRPEIIRKVVRSDGRPIQTFRVQESKPGKDLVLSLDVRIQKLAEDALESGIRAGQGSGYPAPAGAVVVMDPRDGGIRAMATYPTYDASIATDGFSNKEYRKLGIRTPNDPDDDALLNRAIQAQRAPASTFKVVTAGAALALNVADAFTQIDCDASKTYPPGDPTGQVFNNYVAVDFGFIDFSRSLEISCDTFYYELGWDMEQAFGEKEQFQSYARLAGLGHETGIDLPDEAEGRIPDRAWCREIKKATNGQSCASGWLPGFTVNMAIGQGDVVTTPIQMAVTFAAIANGGEVLQPHLASRVSRFISGANGRETEEVVKEVPKTVRAELPLDETELGVIRNGLIKVVSTGEGTARSAFSGFPLDAFQVAGKTGTSQLGTDSDLQDSWFISYAPAYEPEYVIAVYLEKSGFGGESAAPVARQIWEGIFEGDFKDTTVSFGRSAD